MTEIPSFISAHEISTGLIVRGIKINGYYTIVDQCTVNYTQKMEQKHFIQGGPRAAIADIGTKHIEGQISCPVRIGYFDIGDRTLLILDPAIKMLLDNAQNPDFPIIIETNHTLANINVTTSTFATNENELLTMDCCLVKNLTLSATEEGITLTADISGMIDTRAETALISPPEGYLLGRQLSFADCDISRYESDMRTVNKFEIQVINDVELPIFVMPYETLIEDRTDQPYGVGVSAWKCEGSFDEVLRQGIETETYIHGGFMVNENLQISFSGIIIATIPVPLFEIGEQPLSKDYLKRTTKFKSQISPQLRNSEGDLFSYS
jgi:hypothetical protein